MTSVPELRPLAMGEMVDRAATFWRQNFKALFTLYLPFQLVQYIVLKAYTFAVLHRFPVMRGGAATNEQIQADPAAAARQLFGVLALFVGMMLVYLLITWLSAVAGTRYVVAHMLGEQVTLGDALARVRARAGAVLGGYGLSLVWIVAVSIALTAPGVAMVAAAVVSLEGSPAALALAFAGLFLFFFGFLAAALWYLLRFFLTPQVIAAEELSAVESVRRSGELVSGRVGPGFMDRVKMRATVLITVVALILTAVSVLAGLPATIVTLSYGGSFTELDPSRVPQALVVPAELLQVLAQAAFGPLYVVFGALFYLDMRMRREGLDIERRLEAARPRVAA